MKLNQVAAQFYTVRDYCKTSAEFAESCRKTRAIGYQAIQVSGIGPIPEDEIVRICAGEGLVICATHESSTAILDEPAKVVDPYPVGVSMADLQVVRDLAHKLDRSGEIMRKAGKVLSYHNHAIEFMKLGGKTALEIIYEESNPQNLRGEIDTYWVQVGGADPVAWCRKLNGRLPALHLKDCVGTANNVSAFCEIGHGNLNFKEIIAAAESSGCGWFIVEQDTCPGNPFDSLKISFDYIAAKLVS